MCEKSNLKNVIVWGVRFWLCYGIRCVNQCLIFPSLLSSPTSDPVGWLLCQPLWEHQWVQGTWQSRRQGVNTTQCCWRCDTSPLHIDAHRINPLHDAPGIRPGTADLLSLSDLTSLKASSALHLTSVEGLGRNICHCTNRITERDDWQSSGSGTCKPLVAVWELILSKCSHCLCFIFKCMYTTFVISVPNQC